MTRPLNSDELGAKGEKRLAELLLDARLTPNSPDRDRVGWDNVVTWPLDETAPLDSRPSPLAAHIQLKTIWAGNENVLLNLATLEFIVKDSRPAFLVIFEVDDSTLDIARAHIIHIAGEFLAEILQRLRAARAQALPATGLTYSPSIARWSTELAGVSGSLLKAAMEVAIPEGMAAYEQSKRRELAELGYERGAMRLSATIDAGSQDELIDGFLGLRMLPIKDLRQTETRFGIPIDVPELPWPADEISSAIRVNARRSDRCVVTMRSSDHLSPIEMHADFFVVPRDITGPDRVVVEARTALARIRIDAADDWNSSVIFASLPGIANLKARATEWRDYFYLATASTSGTLQIEFKPRKLAPPPPVQVEKNLGPCRPEAESYARLAEAADAVDWALDAANAPDTKLRWVDIVRAAPDLLVLRAFKLSPANVEPLFFSAPFLDEAMSEGQRDILYVNRVPIGEKQIVYAARTQISRASQMSEGEWTTSAMQLELVRKINRSDQAFQKFLHDAKKYTGIREWFGPQPKT